jgi:hypothetical protein
VTASRASLISVLFHEVTVQPTLGAAFADIHLAKLTIRSRNSRNRVLMHSMTAMAEK